MTPVQVDHRGCEGRTVRADANELSWAGAVELEHAESWSRGWRLPLSRIDLFPGGDLSTRAANQAGVRVSFGTDASWVSAQAAAVDVDKNQSVDVVVDGVLVDSLLVGRDGTTTKAELPAGPKTVELWLPQTGDFRLSTVTIDRGRRVWREEAAQRPRMITYGSSITECAAAASPARSWPAIVARQLDLDLLCLGFGGQCHLDPMIGRLIRDEPADVIVTCLGINIYGSGTFTRRSLLPNILGFLSTLRDGHPDTPVLVISPIAWPVNENVAGKTGMTLIEVRAQVRDAVALLRRHGDQHLHYLSGLDVLGERQADLLSEDGLHPGPAGYEHIARSLTPAVARLLPHDDGEELDNGR